MTTIYDKLQQVRGRLSQACAAAGRDPASVALLAVSKTFGADALAQAVAAGQRAFGENYIQEGVAKIAALRAALPGAALQWHCIGPIQGNKTRPVAEHFDWVHTVDRLRIAERLSAQRPAHLPPLQVCIQVNVDGDPNKSGVAPADAPDLVRAVAQLPCLRVRGLMSIPDHAPDFEAQRAVHLRAKQLFDQIRGNAEPGLEDFDTLSLGMTADLEAAVQAGSTLVRVGTGIFGGRDTTP
ncbi:YggS family pyridoxal phosphate-dependent enzyme [Verminephrobacter aporrectodeae]|uniref:YggS family pyridoxal phosphate-dependent enzyme n=1 Tax=Verminephrobacter aporrectodeae TaxID=1110389 RepID=UPI002243235F|nr:YggS family pyridoxal phosphate-dependent enzyme [Verminephrobacter aporrectodeae]MCW8175620.1 YggS family pyridoxal phosphate-dependent enzyme [Verminephrobacter aporrectodeae subsp. tuberculatae]MCW8203205.1 YggS family pyridoxal phosphate-dependent enzyme [Verminephrobacter aporrectodeae subsp. tuberculatae]